MQEEPQCQIAVFCRQKESCAGDSLCLKSRKPPKDGAYGIIFLNVPMDF